jgi:hypothetical protein
MGVGSSPDRSFRPLSCLAEVSLVSLTVGRE